MSRMFFRLTGVAAFLVLCAVSLSLGAAADSTAYRIAIEWRDGRPQGQITVTDGNLLKMAVVRGQGAIEGEGRFAAAQSGAFRLALELRGTPNRYGPGSTVVRVDAAREPFSFFLRDVGAEFPIYIPEYGVIVTTGADTRSYVQVDAAIRAHGLQTKLQQIEGEPEENFEIAAANTRNVSCQTWLGLSRDMRIFAFSERLEWIQPRFHGVEVPLPETHNTPARYNFTMGRGWGVVDKISRRLEDGVLPILHGTLVDDDIRYDLVSFAAFESRPLIPKNVRGTHYLLADGHGRGHSFTKEQQQEYDRLYAAQMDQPEETVLFTRITALNTAAVPRYAFLKSACPGDRKLPYRFDAENGFGMYNSGRVFSVSNLNNKALAAEELTYLLRPGETVILDMYVPHRPLSPERALKLRGVRFEERLSEVRRFWKDKLAAAASVSLPERRMTEMVRAGLLHLDLVAYGLEPDGSVLPATGHYTAIGSESAPITQFMDSMGWHDVARRTLMFFLDKQHEDGLMQNFGGYMVETGAVLWSMGEHYRYTRDDAWVRQVAPRLIKSCDYIQRWRQRNMREDLRGNGYGLLDGKVADPNDPYRAFMLNGYAYLGLSRAAEMLKNTDAGKSQELYKEAEALKKDIRVAFFNAMGKAPVVPLASGAWSPTVAPFAEYRGPLVLLADGGKWFTHGSMVSRDSLSNPAYLVFQEIIDPMEPAIGLLMNYNNDLMTKRNVGFSQPYYSRHPVAHLMRGEVKPFLKSYYDTVAAMADRETYTFWEHFYGASPHKTHEEGWFLMETRWMLYMESGQGLNLLPGIPRAWMEDGKQIDLKNVATYFGPVSLHVASALENQHRITAEVECQSGRPPKYVELRLPHPGGSKAVWVRGGTYDAATEKVRIEPFLGRAEVTLGFQPEM